MLSPNSLLQQGRYLIIRDLWNTGSRSLYQARDNVSDQAVLVNEINDRTSANERDDEKDLVRFNTEFEHLCSVSTGAILGLRDHFVDSGSKYIVSGPSHGHTIGELAVGQLSPLDPIKVVRGLTKIVENLSDLAASDRTISTFHTDPSSLLVSSGGDLKYVYFGNRTTEQSAFPIGRQRAHVAFAFMPLEAVWEDLDLVSQKAISHSYNEHSLEELESKPDFRTDIAVLASAAYFLLTGVIPPGALERSIEILEGNVDPLVAPSEHSSLIPPQFSDLIVRSMSLKRRDRYSGLDALLADLSGLDHGGTEVDDEAVDAGDDTDILELPVMSATAVAARSGTDTAGFAHLPASIGSEPTSLASESTLYSAKTYREPAADLPANANDTFESLESNPHTDEDIEPEIFSEVIATRPWFLSPVFLGLVILAIAGGVGGWLWLSNSGSIPNGTKLDARSVILAPGSSEPSTTAAPVDLQIPAQAYDQSVSANTPAEPPVPTTGTVDASTGRVRSAAGPKAKPVVKSSVPETKKKVTVDDLISDN